MARASLEHGPCRFSSDFPAGASRRERGGAAGRRGDRPGGSPRGACSARRTAWRCALYARNALQPRSEEHTSELQSLMRISYAVFCLKKKKTTSNDVNIKYNNVLK